MEDEGRPLRVIVSVNGQKFRVPCSRSSGHSVGWLGDNVARRYERHNKLPEDTVKICELRGHDGSVLDPTDPVIDACDEMEELVGVLEYLTVSASGRSGGTETVSKPICNGSNRVEEVVPPIKTQAVDAIIHREQSSSADPAAMKEPDAPMVDTREQLDSWAAEAWKVNSVEGHRDGVTCVEWTDSLVLSGGRYRNELSFTYPNEGTNLIFFT
jgi:hypothetical protein